MRSGNSSTRSSSKNPISITAAASRKITSIEFENPTKNGCASCLLACFKKAVSFRLDDESFWPCKIESNGLFAAALVTLGSVVTAWKDADFAAVL